MNVILFGNWVFANVVKMKLYWIRVVPRCGRSGNSDRGKGRQIINKQVNSAHTIKFWSVQWRSIKLIMGMGKLSRAGDTVILKEMIKESFTKVILKHLKEG